MRDLMLMRMAALALTALSGGAAMAQAETCTVAVGTLAFGAYMGAQNNSSAALTVRCTRNRNNEQTLVYEATLSSGAGTYSQRRMTSGLETLNYNLYLTTVPAVLNTNVWGDGTGGTVKAIGTFFWAGGDREPRTSTNTVAGAIPGAAYPSPGLYQDLISVTLTYN